MRSCWCGWCCWLCLLAMAECVCGFLGWMVWVLWVVLVFNCAGCYLLVAIDAVVNGLVFMLVVCDSYCRFPGCLLVELRWFLVFMVFC